MVELQFEDPPEYRPPAGRLPQDTKKNAGRAELVAALQDHPNRWAIVSRHQSRNRANQVAGDLRRRHQPRGSSHYEFRAARKPDGQGVVYGRWVETDVNLGT